ncbi:Probable deferrochelatase/peroxidase EfeN [Listeria monocytogenes]|nr:Probable deferrochelatase/peroxidase EfeN [Listeria monocytogenes]
MVGISNFTVTLGYGPTFFEKGGKDRFGVKAKKPKYLEKIPHMAHDSLDEAYSDGDLCIQVCADDQQVAFHGIRNFIRLASGVAVVRWIEEGFLSAPKNETPRNLFGFKDGTANVDHDSNKGYEDVVWAENDEPEWMRNGSYLGYRKIQMLIEIWDRSSFLVGKKYPAPRITKNMSTIKSIRANCQLIRAPSQRHEATNAPPRLFIYKWH